LAVSGESKPPLAAGFSVVAGERLAAVKLAGRSPLRIFAESSPCPDDPCPSKFWAGIAVGPFADQFGPVSLLVAAFETPVNMTPRAAAFSEAASSCWLDEPPCASGSESDSESGVLPFDDCESPSVSSPEICNVGSVGGVCFAGAGGFVWGATVASGCCDSPFEVELAFVRVGLAAFRSVPNEARRNEIDACSDAAANECRWLPLTPCGFCKSTPFRPCASCRAVALAIVSEKSLSCRAAECVVEAEADSEKTSVDVSALVEKLLTAGIIWRAWCYARKVATAPKGRPLAWLPRRPSLPGFRGRSRRRRPS